MFHILNRQGWFRFCFFLKTEPQLNCRCVARTYLLFSNSSSCSLPFLFSTLYVHLFFYWLEWLAELRPPIWAPRRRPCQIHTVFGNLMQLLLKKRLTTVMFHNAYTSIVNVHELNTATSLIMLIKVSKINPCYFVSFNTSCTTFHPLQ